MSQPIIPPTALAHNLRKEGDIKRMATKTNHENQDGINTQHKIQRDFAKGLIDAKQYKHLMRSADDVPPGWTIVHEPPPIPDRNFDWQFYHKDYEFCSDTGSNGLAGLACSREDALRQIQEIEEDRNG